MSLHRTCIAMMLLAATAEAACADSKSRPTPSTSAAAANEPVPTATTPSLDDAAPSADGPASDDDGGASVPPPNSMTSAYQPKPVPTEMIAPPGLPLPALDPKLLRRAVIGERCFADRKTAIQLVVRVTVGPDFTAKKVHVLGTTTTAAQRACVEALLLKATWKASAGEVVEETYDLPPP